MKTVGEHPEQLVIAVAVLVLVAVVTALIVYATRRIGRRRRP